MRNVPIDSTTEFQRFLRGAIDEIEALDRMPESPGGEARMRYYASIAGAVGLQAVHTGFTDLHSRSLQFPPFIERTTALTFIADCLARCREAAATETPTTATRDALMTAAEVAEYLGITVRSVRRRVLDGTLPKPAKIGRSVRFRRQDIEAVAAGK